MIVKVNVILRQVLPHLDAQLIGRANQWAAKLGKQDSLFFISGNATVSLRKLLTSYPGPINLVSIQVGCIGSYDILHLTHDLKERCRSIIFLLQGLLSSLH